MDAPAETPVIGRRLLPAAVFFASAGTLVFEVLLVRVFAIEYVHHFAYLAVGVAMLGFGASGTALAVLARADAGRLRGIFLASAVATPLLLLVSPALAHRVALDPTQLAWDPRQWLLLALVEATLALPFFAGGLVTLTALTLARDRPGRVYGAGFFGAGVGATVAVGTLALWAPDRALAAPAAVAALGAAGVALGGPSRPWVRAIACLPLPLAALAVAAPPWNLAVSSYKSLAQVSAYPQAEHVSETASPVGWVVEVDAEAFHYGPGLSLAYGGTFPRQSAIFVDGDLAGSVNRWRDAEQRRAFASHLPGSAPYVLRAPHRVLLVGAGDGLEAALARAHGARSVTAVELHPGLARRQQAAHDGDGQGTEASDAPSRWIVSDARGYLERTRDRFDLIVLGPGGAFGASAAGTHTLNEDFLHTTDAHRLYLGRLRPGGVLSVTRWLTGPPREPVLTILTACDALRAAGAGDRSLLVVRSWATVTILAKPSGFTPAEIRRLVSWAETMQFDIDWRPGIEAPPEAGHHRLEEPVLYEAARAGLSGAREADAFAAGYPWLVAPRSDARPYTHHFLRLASLRSFFESGRAAWIPFAEWGLIALVATLAVSIPLAALFLIAPSWLRRREGSASPRGAIVAYFGAIGFAYLAAEIAAIQQLGLLLGHPVYAVVAALAVILIGSGVGSVLSDRLDASRSRIALGLLAAVLALEALLLLGAVHRALAAPLSARIAVALVALLPPAVMMGVPFPAGLRTLAHGAPQRAAWAWAANGFATVVAAPLSALLALQFGSGSLFGFAAAAYAAALALLVRSAGRSTRHAGVIPGTTG